MPVGHTVGDLFVPEPAQWGLRGDPVLWRALRERCAALEMPRERSAVERLLHAQLVDAVGVDLREPDHPATIHRAEFESHGMSSGIVDLAEWDRRFLPLLNARAAALLAYSWVEPRG